MSVELKILVSYDEWELLKRQAEQHENCKIASNAELERLRKIEKEHENCFKKSNDKGENNLSTLSGGGVGAAGDCADLKEHCTVMPKTVINTQKNIDDTSNFEKNVIVDKSVQIPSNHEPSKILSDSDIIQHIKESFKSEAKTLLNKLSAYPTEFSYDSNGILKIFGTTYPGRLSLDIVNLIAADYLFSTWLSGNELFQIREHFSADK